MNNSKKYYKELKHSKERIVKSLNDFDILNKLIKLLENSKDEKAIKYAKTVRLKLKTLEKNY